MQKGKISLYTAAAIVIANMIGTGVFTSLGFQVVDIQSVFVLLMLWAVGGITAYCGAISYAELGARLPRSGGEYNFLKETFHPALGVTAGWVSATVGFAAPTALAAITFGVYLSQVFPVLDKTLLAIGLLGIITIVHATAVRNSSLFQRIFTSIKIILIIAFILLAWLMTRSPQEITLLPQPGDWDLFTSRSFAVSLIYVSYAYTGWNAATYVINELDNPSKNLPLALGVGTLVVMVLYIGLNHAFLFTSPIDELAGKIEIGYISAGYIFGSTGTKVMGSILALLLISTVSAMVFAGPRVIQMMGEDIKQFRFFGKTNKNGVPSRAIWTQSILSFLFIITASFESILVFAGFSLAATSFMTVFGLFRLRKKQKGKQVGYLAWGYPLTPIIYLLLTGWTLIFILIEKPLEALAGVGILVSGLVVYYLTPSK